MDERHTQVLVVGGGLGGVAAAFTAARHGRHVILTEPTTWIGGVLTSQAVPPDEHIWIEQFGCTATYRTLREQIRQHYRNHYPLTERARASGDLNPGAARVSGLCFEPRVALAVLETMLAPHRSAGRIHVLLRHRPVAADTDGDLVRAVTLHNQDLNTEIVISADWVLDATETGDLLPLCGAEYVTGAESVHDTGEPHAPAQAQPRNMQPISVCFALDHVDDADYTLDPPPGYQSFKQAAAVDWPDGQLSFTAPNPKTRHTETHTFAPNPDDDVAMIGPDYDDRRVATRDRNLWTFRRIAARNNFTPGSYDSDITLVNWPQMDYWGGPVYDNPDAEHHLDQARNLSLSLLHWLHTEAPRPDGRTGWPGLRLRGDITGDTADGLAMAPYIRESRRIRAEHTIVEQDVALELRGHHGAATHPDSVGIGSYRIDLHPTTGGDSYLDIACCPFELPLGALIPVRLDNLLPSARNIGTTHITNGSYRMPAVEWNTGEVAAHLVSFSINRKIPPRTVRADPKLLADFLRTLHGAGVETRWPHIEGY